MASLGFILVVHANGQTASTGALAGVTVDSSGATLPGVIIHLTTTSVGETRSATSDEEGRFAFQFLPPGTYQLQATKTDFAPLELPELHVSVTETLRVELRLQIAAHFERALAVAGLGVPKDRVIDGVDQRAFFEGK
jgi:Carboxypeptidase regulatory-like domain